MRSDVVRTTNRRRAATAASIAIWVVACGANRHAPRGPTALARSSPNEDVRAEEKVDSTSKPSTANESPDSVVAAALAQVSRIRELAATGNVRGVALSHVEMAAHVKATIEHEVPASIVAAEGEILIALGVAPLTFDYMKATVSLMSAELAGYYEPSEKTMYIASDLGGPERSATLAHELVHALQDQHYDLGKLLEYRSDQSDAQGALHALAEGDATSAMLDQLLEPKGAKATDLSESLLGLQVRAAAQFTPGSSDVPDILKRSLVAPYIDGIGFVHWLRRRGSWAAVDAAWQRPPESTEQLLHPEKYLSREPPLVVAVPVSPDASQGPAAYTDVFGEESLELLFEEWLPRMAAAEAATGWGGDRVAVFREPKTEARDSERIAVGWHLRYDTDDTASRGARALAKGVAAQPGGVPSRDASPAVCVDRATLGPILMERRGRDIAVVSGPYDRAGNTVVAAGTCNTARAWARRILAQP